MTGAKTARDSEGSADTGELEQLRQRLEEEQRQRQEAEHELEIQTCLKAEMEVAMKLLEKDIHEKQDTIVSLRRQLDDIKLINLEMYKKLQVSYGQGPLEVGFSVLDLPASSLCLNS